MSTKQTLLKRVALVAVSALGFGLLSVMPANAAAIDNTDSPTFKAWTVTNSSTTLAARVGQEVTIPITGTWTVGASTASAVWGISVAASITSQPATSTVYPTLLTSGSVQIGVDELDTFGFGLSASTANTIATGSGTTGTASSVATINYVASDESEALGAGTNNTVATATFTPTVAGTYSLTVWAESDRAYGRFSAAANSGVATATSQASLSGSESYKVFTINVSAGVSTVSLTPLNTSVPKFVSGAYGLNGALIKVSLKDAAGNAAILAPGETVTLTPSGTGDIDQVNGVDVTSTAGAAYNLASTAFNSAGVAWVNMINETAETVNLTASINGGATTSTAITYRTVVAAPTAAVPGVVQTEGFRFSTPNYSVAQGTSTLTFKIPSINTGSYASFIVVEELVDSVGTITGYTSALSYDIAAAGNTTATYASASVTASAASNGTLYKATFGATSGATKDDATVGSEAVVATVNRTADSLTSNPSIINSVAGASNTVTVTLKDNFGVAYPYQTISATVAGKNPVTVARTAVTDANGQATFTFTDANTNTAVSDVVTFAAGSGATTTITYGTNTVSKVTLEYPGDTDVVAGTTFTEISAAGAGATGTSAAVTAVVTGSTGALLAGVPVTFAVSGLTGAEVHTTLVTVYTDTNGEATTAISSYAAGKATVTATAGGVSSSADIYFYQTGTGEARTIAATVSGSVVTATVKDRYGNTIEGVDVNATRTGSGYFGSGASTASGKTDKKGQVEFIFTGTGTVTVAFTSTTFGQSADAAGKVGITAVTAAAAGTTTTAQKGLGAALAPAGVNSASVAVASVDAAAAAADAAADAAAEAIDAANAATDAANLAAEAADAATVAAEEARDAADAATAAVEELATQVATLMAALKAQITTLANTVAKIAKKVKA